MRVGRVAVGDSRNAKGSHIRRKKWEYVGRAEGPKRIGNRITGGTCIAISAVKFVGYSSKRRQPAKLQVERPVFDVVKDSEAAAHHNLAAAKHIPGESEARGKIIVVGIDESTIGSAGIAWVQNSQGRIWKYG